MVRRLDEVPKRVVYRDRLHPEFAGIQSTVQAPEAGESSFKPILAQYCESSIYASIHAITRYYVTILDFLCRA